MSAVSARRPGELRVLGPLEIAGPAGTARISAPQHRRLLGALLVERGVTRSTDGLIDALWGSSPPASAAKVLQMYVSKLRKQLPACARIVTRGAGYALEVDDDAVDAGRFERLLAEARSAAREGNPALAASLLRRALGLWRGQAYGDAVGSALRAAQRRYFVDGGYLERMIARGPLVSDDGREWVGDATLIELRDRAAVRLRPRSAGSTS